MCLKFRFYWDWLLIRQDSRYDIHCAIFHKQIKSNTFVIVMYVSTYFVFDEIAPTGWILFRVRNCSTHNFYAHAMTRISTQIVVSDEPKIQKQLSNGRRQLWSRLPSSKSTQQSLHQWLHSILWFHYWKSVWRSGVCSCVWCYLQSERTHPSIYLC